jgi:transcriptional regulator with XRE-family HTH domain
MSKQNFSNPLQEQVKTTIKSLNLDQQQLAEKLGLTQAAISKALNGKSDRSFQRLLVLLSNEYGVSFEAAPKTVENEALEAIKNELKEIKQGIEELKEMFGRFEQ